MDKSQNCDRTWNGVDWADWLRSVTGKFAARLIAFQPKNIKERRPLAKPPFKNGADGRDCQLTRHTCNALQKFCDRRQVTAQVNTHHPAPIKDLAVVNSKDLTESLDFPFHTTVKN
jgi:hypothetical protein